MILRKWEVCYRAGLRDTNISVYGRCFTLKGAENCAARQQDQWYTQALNAVLPKDDRIYYFVRERQ